MTPLSIRYLLLALIALAPCLAQGAEPLKLRAFAVLTGDNNQKQLLLKTPNGVACNDKQAVVADSGNGRLVRYALEEDGIKEGAPLNVPELLFPIHVQFDSRGNIFALDGKIRRVVRLKPQGGADNFEIQGAPAPATVVPSSFKIDANDQVYLLDIFGERVLVADTSGKFTRQVPFPKGYRFISDLAVNPNGDILLLDSVAGAILVAKKESPSFAVLVGNMNEYLDFSTNLTTDARGVIYVTDHDGGAVVAFGQDGGLLGRQLSLGWKAGQLYYPSEMCINKSGLLFVADRANNRVQVFQMIK